MSESDQRKSKKIHEELVAYLDGELDAQAKGQIEERLARDDVYRIELRRMQRAWDLLENLPKRSVDETFTNTTINMVAVEAAKNVDPQGAAGLWQDPWKHRWRWLIGGGSLLAAGLAGFLAVALILPNDHKTQNDQIVRDLPVLENLELYQDLDKNLELYQQIDDIEFAHSILQLQEEGVFDEELDDAT